MSNVLNLATIRAELKARLKRPNLSNTRVDRWINITQDEIIRSMDPDHLIESADITTVEDQRSYYVECTYNKIKDVINESTEVIMKELSEKDIRIMDPDLGNTGDPFAYSIGKRSMVLANPSSDSVISVVSSSASDSSQAVRIRGSLDGVRVADSVDLNGTTAANGTVTMDTVYEVILDDECAGYVTVSSNSAAVTQAVIPADELFVEYQQINLYYTPSADDDTIKVYYLRPPRPLTSASDIPDLPSEWHDLVLRGAVIIGLKDIFEYTLASKLEQEFFLKVNDLNEQMGQSRNKQRKIRLSSKYNTSSRPSNNVLATDV